jgi:hypothetical protein
VLVAEDDRARVEVLPEDRAEAALLKVRAGDEPAEGAGTSEVDDRDVAREAGLLADLAERRRAKGDVGEFDAARDALPEAAVLGGAAQEEGAPAPAAGDREPGLDDEARVGGGTRAEGAGRVVDRRARVRSPVYGKIPRSR